MVSLKVEAANASAHLADPKEEPGVLDTGLLSLHINVCLRARACVYMVYRLAAQRRALLRNSRIVRDLSLLLAIAFTCGGGFIRTNSDHACPFAVYIYIHVYIMCVCVHIYVSVCVYVHGPLTRVMLQIWMRRRECCKPAMSQNFSRQTRFWPPRSLARSNLRGKRGREQGTIFGTGGKGGRG
jgi:hypothetical protein